MHNQMRMAPLPDLDIDDFDHGDIPDEGPASAH